MTGEADTERGVTMSGKKFAHPTHLLGCTGKAMDEQTAQVTGDSREEKWLCCRNNLIHPKTDPGTKITCDYSATLLAPWKAE
jgi:hypothetical protein